MVTLDMIFDSLVENSLVSTIQELQTLTAHNRLTIKCDRNKTHAALHTQQLIDNHTFRVDPASEVEVAQSREYKIWKPIPAE